VHVADYVLGDHAVECSCTGVEITVVDDFVVDIEVKSLLNSCVSHCNCLVELVLGGFLVPFSYGNFIVTEQNGKLFAFKVEILSRNDTFKCGLTVNSCLLFGGLVLRSIVVALFCIAVFSVLSARNKYSKNKIKNE
jgi:hypothetical protein